MMTIFKDVILNTHKANKQGVESCSLDHDDQAWHELNYGNGVDSGRSGPDEVNEYFWIMATGRLKQDHIKMFACFGTILLSSKAVRLVIR